MQVSQRFTELAGPDCVVGRIGGDEFVIAGSSGSTQAPELAQRLMAGLLRPIKVPGLELVLTASLGLVEHSDQADAQELFRDGDVAMYRAKGQGRDRVQVFEPSMRQAMRQHVEIEVALRQALRRGELWLAYQPIVDVRSGAVVGAEALVRWTHPQRGVVLPGEFVPIAEESGLIVELGSWVLQEALSQFAAWRDAGGLPEDFGISVNVSTRQLRDHGLRELVRHTLDVHRLPPDRVNLEITESVMIASQDAIRQMLFDLRDLGIRLSVDDFGTGYSSLSYLHRFPVTEVKVDRSFVQTLDAERRDEAIVRAVASMADALSLEVIAEGVETQAQRDVLRRLGIPRAQGWLWGKAVGEAEFAARHLAGARTSTVSSLT